MAFYFGYKRGKKSSLVWREGVLEMIKCFAADSIVGLLLFIFF